MIEEKHASGDYDAMFIETVSNSRTGTKGWIYKFKEFPDEEFIYHTPFRNRFPILSSA